MCYVGDVAVQPLLPSFADFVVSVLLCATRTIYHKYSRRACLIPVRHMFSLLSLVRMSVMKVKVRKATRRTVRKQKVQGKKGMMPITKMKKKSRRKDLRRWPRKKRERRKARTCYKMNNSRR